MLYLVSILHSLGGRLRLPFRRAIRLLFGRFVS